MDQPQRQQLSERLGLDRNLLQCLLRQLPVHPRQWSILPATCTELHVAMNEEREILRREICCKHQQEEPEEVRWSSQWAAELLLKLTKAGETAEAIRVIVAGAPLDCHCAVGNDGITAMMLVGRDGGGITAMMLAARYGNVELMDALISAGAQLDLQNGEGDTALILASIYGHVEIALALIDAGAQPELQNDEGSTALVWASVRGHTEIAEALMEA